MSTLPDQTFVARPRGPAPPNYITSLKPNYGSWTYSKLPQHRPGAYSRPIRQLYSPAGSIGASYARNLPLSGAVVTGNGALNTPGQRVFHPHNMASQYPKIAELTYGANMEGPVDLSLRSKKERTPKKVPKPRPTSELAPKQPVKSLPIPTFPKSTPIQVQSGQVVQSAYLICGYCPFKANSKDVIENHILSSHPQLVVVVPKTFTCNYCQYVTSSELCMVRHLLTLHRSKILPSQIGNAKTNNLFSCSVCVFSADEATMITHMLDHYKDSTPCNSCTSCVGSNRPSLQTTRKRKAPAAGQKKPKFPGTRQNKKDQCSTSMASAVNETLSNKLLSQKTDTFKCKICTAHFVTIDQLKEHNADFHAAPTSRASDSKSPKKPESPARGQSTSEEVVSNLETLPSSTTPEITIINNNQLTLSQPLTPPSSECDGQTTEDPTIVELPELQSTSEHDSVALRTPASSNSTATCIPLLKSIEASATHEPQDTVSTTMPSTTFTPMRKRKLAMKIFKNHAGEYQSERSDTPKVNTVPEEGVVDSISAKHLKLCVQVPLEVLPSRQQSSSTSDLQSPTHLQIPLELLLKGKQKSAKRLDSNDSDPEPIDLKTDQSVQSESSKQQENVILNDGNDVVSKDSQILGDINHPLTEKSIQITEALTMSAIEPEDDIKKEYPTQDMEGKNYLFYILPKSLPTFW